MPRQDGTGPLGNGPRGRGRGFRGQGRGAPFQTGPALCQADPGMGAQTSRVQRNPRADETVRPKGAAKTGTIAVSSQGPDLDSPLETRFGRAAGFIVVDPGTMEFRFLDNTIGREFATGAGIQAAEAVSRSGANVVITGSPGPKAMKALNAAGISVVQNPGGQTVRQVVDRFRKEEMTSLNESSTGAELR